MTGREVGVGQPDPGVARGGRHLGPTDPDAEGLPEPLVDVDRLISGGPPPDGIPSVDDPKFDRARTVDFLEPDERVLALSLEGQERAYPVQILIWHEIVNDTVGVVPVVVTYCPLCNSALAFDRRAADRVLTFGVSGRLLNSDLVMFDRQTESLWPQLKGRAVAGVLTGTELTAYPIQTVPWREWSDANPDGLVLNRDTGHDRRYGQNPYVGYDEVGTDPFLLDVEADDRLPAKEPVVGLGDGPDAVAGFVDAETGTTWSVLGTATAGELAGERLEPVRHVDTFWFSWALFQPDTAMIR